MKKFYGLDVEVEVYKQSFWVSILGLERLGGNESIHSCYSHVAVTQNGVIKPDPYLVAMSENVVLHTKGSGLSGMNTKITKWQYRNHYNGTVRCSGEVYRPDHSTAKQLLVAWEYWDDSLH